MNRLTSENVNNTLDQFMIWLEKENIGNAGGRKEHRDHGRIILNDIESNKWDLTKYLEQKERNGKPDGSPYEDSTMNELRRTHSYLMRFHFSRK